MFRLWSETDPRAKKILTPDLGLRSWDDLSEEEKDKIWHYMEQHFFDREIREEGPVYERKRYYKFYGGYKEVEYKQGTVLITINTLNENCKARAYADTFLKNRSLNAACYDFAQIFLKQTETVVMEMLSIYAKFYYEITKKDVHVWKEEDEQEDSFIKRKIEAEHGYFDDFADRLNDVFLQFGIKYHLTRDGFVPRQDEKIIKEIYEPVLSYLSDPKWKEVNNLLSDAFTDYRKNTPQGYSSCVTNVVSAIQAFLQITVNGKTGKGEISNLIQDAQKKALIPGDFFTTTIFDRLESILARERQETSTAHPKKQYANEKNARLVMNLA